MPSFSNRQLAICMLTLVTLAGAALAQTTRNVLVLHSYHQGLRWTDRITEGIESQLRPLSDTIELHYDYLDTKRNAGEEYYQHLVAFERFKRPLSRVEFEVIIASDNNALRFLLEHGDELYPGVPIVFCGVNNFHPDMLHGRRNITGVAETIDVAGNLELMSSLHPDRRRLLVIIDDTPTGRAIRADVERAAAMFTDRFEIEYYQDFRLADVTPRITGLSGDSIIYLLTFNRDRDGRFISYLDGIRLIRQASAVPIYGSWEFYFGGGIVGGQITSGYYQGETAARMALQILDGTPTHEIPVDIADSNRPMFDHRELSRFHIDEDGLPPGSLVINRPESFLVRHRRHVVVLLMVALAAAMIHLARLAIERRRALQDVKALSGLLPICAGCKKIRDDQGYWNQLESYIDEHSDASFSHGMCPDCAEKYYPGLLDDSRSTED